MKRYVCLFLFVASFSGCVALPVQTNGRANDVAWSTTAFNSDSESGFQGDTEQYGFTLVLQEMAGIDLTWTKVTWKIEHDGVDLDQEESRTGPWSLPAHGTLGQPFVYRISCPPSASCPDVGPTMQWDISFEGLDAKGRPVQFTLQPVLPWVPQRAVASLASDAQTPPAVVSPPIHITARRLYNPDPSTGR